MSTQTESKPNGINSTSTPEYRSLHRLSSIPIVQSSLSTLHTSLSQNYFTHWPYATASTLSQSVYRVSLPIQVRLAPVIDRVDGFANQGIDVVQEKFPYPFQTQTKDVVQDIKNVTTQTIDVRIRNPARGLAQSIDQGLTPVVDRFESLVTKVHTQNGSDTSTPSSSTPAPSSQIERAYRLSVDLKDQVVILSAEQLKQLQAHSVLVQRTTELVYNLNALVSSSYDNVKGKSTALTKEGYTRLQQFAETTKAELDKLQQNLPNLPTHVAQTLEPLSTTLRDRVNQLQSIVSSEKPLQDKSKDVATVLRESIQPIANDIGKVLNVWGEEIMKFVAGAKQEAKRGADGAKAHGKTYAEAAKLPNGITT